VPVLSSPWDDLSPWGSDPVGRFWPAARNAFLRQQSVCRPTATGDPLGDGGRYSLALYTSPLVDFSNHPRTAM
jgi:hypothetical protein